MKKLIITQSILLFFTAIGFAAKVDTLKVESSSMHKTIKNVIVLPNGYQTTKVDPVVYLLHGATGDYKDWVLKAPDVIRLADTYQVLIVCPDGGFTSWYYDSPIDSTYRYETYVSKELPAYIDGHYATIKDKSGRAITGLSMGGHGGLYLSFRHQDVFGAGGSMSGGVDIRPFPNDWDIAKRLGTLDQNPENWNKNTIVNMVDLLKGGSLKLIIDCGVNDFFYDVNKDLHKKLLEAKYPHDYIERPGVHNWPYWANAVKYQFLFFSEFFNCSANGRK
ncbi:MAG TPA: alpha/beta hydrolase family protein [Bacteroidales bacterium]|nr:alpha/beta hydrolase family protein [Bacteroidales bacterium]